MKVVGRSRGEDKASGEIRTSGKSVKLRLKLDNKLKYANCIDLTLITCYCTYEKGIEVPDA